ncbi:MAG: homoserine dehydrogenase [Hyphomicrobiales bacterium]|nr:homoserine dehydrogenase [Hyphomicrobiales bacterium]MDE2114060.1 homoserine dehydrogenase [Hyphomicrobiales bacterium]
MAQLIRIGIAGLGTVGAAVLRILAEHSNQLELRAGQKLVVTGVSARNRTKDRGVDISALQWFDDPVALARSPDIDLFVELIGGENGPALAAVTAALQSGKSVVTANKALLAGHGMMLAALAEANNVCIGFEAAVAGGIPAIKVLREALAGNNITRVSGILNGTCNYILSRMENEGLSFADCLREAQKLGYAESDPTFDIGGFDTAHKLALLTTLAFGVGIDRDAIHIEGIESITLSDIRAAEELGFRIKLLGVAERTSRGIEQRVHPTMVAKSSTLAQVMGVLNAVSIDADNVGRITLSGPGAGGAATASSVVSDLTDLAAGTTQKPLGLPVASLATAVHMEMQRHEGGYYIRLNVQDRPGAVAAIATRMAERQISMESIVQRHSGPRLAASGPVPVVLITYATSENLVREALEQVERDGFLDEKPQIFRIERE